MIELNKQECCVGENNVPIYAQAYTEGDVIVPDSKPDVAKIIQVTANTVVDNRRCMNDKIIVEGCSSVNIMYVGDNGGICAIKTSLAFNQSIDATGVTDDMYLEIQTDMQSIDYSIINSRKLGIKLLIGIDANASKPLNVPLCISTQGGENVECHKRVIRPYNNVIRDYKQFSLIDFLQLPSGKPDIETILRMDVRLETTDVKTMKDKVIVNGNAILDTFYLGEGDDKNINYIQNEVPFSEMLEAMGADETMYTNVKVNCINSIYEPCCDNDGDNRKINTELNIGIYLSVFAKSEITLIDDLYSTMYPTKVDRKNASVCSLAAKNNVSETFSDNFKASGNINQIYKVFAKPNVSTTKIETNKLYIEGILEICAVYVSDDGMLSTAKHNQKFLKYIDISGITPRMICDASLDVVHVSYTIGSANTIEYRVNIDFDVNIIERNDISYIDNLTVGDEKIDQEECVLRVYFVKNGDTLWNIAKKYRTTVAGIIADNELIDDSDISIGKRLIIN